MAEPAASGAQTVAPAPTQPSPADRTFPTLTPAQVARVAGHGRVRLQEVLDHFPGKRRREPGAVRGHGRVLRRYIHGGPEDHPAIVVYSRTEIVDLEGQDHLERVRWRDNRSGRVETRDIRHVFSMTGAVPSTGWLHGCVALDARGFIKTGPDLSPEELAPARWPLARPPRLLEASLPGVFAVGGVRRRRGIDRDRHRPPGIARVKTGYAEY